LVVGSVGVSGISGTATTPLLGISAASSIGNTVIVANGNIITVGIASVGSVGSVIIQGAATVLLTGILGQSNIGTVTIFSSGLANPNVVGVSNSILVGTVMVTVTSANDTSSPIRKNYNRGRDIQYGI